MIRKLLVLVSLCCCTAVSLADDGLLRLKSHHGVTQTLDRFEAAITQKGMTVFARIDHRKGAERVGMELGPTEVLVFGNPRVGTRLMQSRPSAGIDLPLKVLAYRDAQGDVWLTWNDPAWIAKRHGIHDRADVVKKMQGALQNFARIATRP